MSGSAARTQAVFSTLDVPQGPVPKSKYSFAPRALADLLDHDNQDYRRHVQEIFGTVPLFSHALTAQTVADKGLHGHRDLTLERVRYGAQNQLISVRDYLGNPLKFQAYLETACLLEGSFGVKSGVHFTLCGGAIMSLGTPVQHDEWVPRMDKLELAGCFAMTELSHGSNVLGIETTATFDNSTNEFVINTPHEAAQKIWIGGGALHAQITALFAQLIVNGTNHGVHCFVVPLRDAHYNLLPGVKAADNGLKLGLNGVDNGRLWFDKVRIPLKNLLARYSQVEPTTGKYVSSIENPGVRFATMLGALIGGRVLITASAAMLSQFALLIATRYGFSRTQFPDETGSEVSIMSYLSHQRRLFPSIATAVCTRLAAGLLKDVFVSRSPASLKQVHVLAAGLKAYATWNKQQFVRECREACGGQGLAFHNQIGAIMIDSEVDTTFEGDNSVLYQQVAKALLGEFRKAAKAGKATLPTAPSKAATPEELTALPHLLALYAYRTKDLLMTLVAELQASLKSGVAHSFSDAWDRNCDLALQLANAHVEHTILAHAIHTLQDEKLDKTLPPVLTILARLFALSRIEKDLGYFI
ncbi:hypothetical protein BDK51DRAFT_32551, partial [Blyttiomyces helicus]